MALATVATCREIARDCFLLILQAEWTADIKPGQFVSLHLPGRGTDPLLRRPFSVHLYDCRGKDSRLGILFRVVGKTTAMMKNLQSGEQIDVFGPLGNSFPLPAAGARAALVAGGIGMAPLFYLAEQMRNRSLPFTFLLGGANKSELPEETYFHQAGIVPEIITEDGSTGRRGLVTDLLQMMIAEERPGVVYACGPNRMLKAVADIAGEYKIPAYISLETLMACGVGACLGCICRTRDKGEEIYARICREGPVFPGEAVIFDE